MPRLEVPRGGVVLQRDGACGALAVNLVFADEMAAPIGQDADGQDAIVALGRGSVVGNALHARSPFRWGDAPVGVPQ